MADRYFSLTAEAEAELDFDQRPIVVGLRELCREIEYLQPTDVSAASEERHLRLRITDPRNEHRSLDLLVGDGYTEIQVGSAPLYRGYMTPEETVAFVRDHFRPQL